ncbi:MAG: HD domain-containing protein [Patescibacteria group bacterium]
MKYLTVYKKFRKNIAKFPDKEKEKIWQAYLYAKKYHKGQICYPGFPFIIHPMGAANFLMEFGYWEHEMVMSALLHDVVEDTPATLKEVKKKFGNRVYRLVRGNTRIKPKSETTQLIRFRNKIAKFRKTMKASKEIRAIKCCDLLFNVSWWRYNPKKSWQTDKFPRRIKEAQALYLPLAQKTDRRIYLRMKKEYAKFLKWYGKKPKFP